MSRQLVILALITPPAIARADIAPQDAAAYFDFARSHGDLTQPRQQFERRRLTRVEGQPLEFTDPLQLVEAPPAHAVGLAKRLDGIQAMSVGGWFYVRRSGEQVFFSRGLPEVGALGERFFRRNEHWVNFCLGNDQHGFLMGTINGNGSMPFVHVTLNELRINCWHQLVIVKDAKGFQHFYHNGRLVHSDCEAVWGGKVWPFRETGQQPPEPLRLAVPLGGHVGEVWVFSRELTADEIRKDYAAKRARYKPAPPGEPVELREMNAHFARDLWREPPTTENWPRQRRRIEAEVMKLLGPFPKEKVPLDAQVHDEMDCGRYLRRKISFAVQPGDRMPAYLLVPKGLTGRAPAVICMYGTTSGAGKETTIGLSGGKPGTPPEKNRAFAIDVAEAGMVALAPDWLRDGERLPPSKRPYDTSDFYRRFPDWSVHGKDAWDTSRAIDYLQTLDFVDGDAIAMMGHSYGGHSTIFHTALEPRIKAAVANGPVSEFRDHGLHWGVPKGAGNRQSLPNLRPYLLDPDRPLPVAFHEFTALIAPRPLLVGQAVGERRPREEENHAAVRQVYQALGKPEAVRYVWYPGDHDFPPAMRRAAVEWLKRGLRP